MHKLELGSVIPNRYQYQLSKEKTKTWYACPVTISAVALMDERNIEDFIRWLGNTEGINEKFQVKPPSDDSVLKPLWNSISSIELVRWVKSRFVAIITMSVSENGGFVRYADGQMIMQSAAGKMQEIPETVRVASYGEDMTRLLKHPIFHGLKWKEKGSDERNAAVTVFENEPLNGPECSIFLGGNLSTKLLKYAQKRQQEMLSVLPEYV